MKTNTRFFARFLLLCFVLLMMLMFAGCRSKKATLDKKQEKVIELEHKDIRKTETAKIETSILKITDETNFSIEPINGQNLSKVIYKGDTLSFQNAKIKYGKTSTSEDNSSITNNQKNEQDNSITKTASESSEKNRTTKTKSSSWGMNLGIIFAFILIVIGGYMYFTK